MPTSTKTDILSTLQSFQQEQDHRNQLRQTFECAFAAQEETRQRLNQLEPIISGRRLHYETMQRNGQNPDRSDLDQLIAERDALLLTFKKQEAHVQRINQELRDSEIAINHPIHAVSHDDVLTVQALVAEKRSALLKTEAAITEEQQKIAAIAIDESPVATLQRQLEDLLADGASDKEIEKRQTQLNAARAELQRSQEAAAILTERAQQTIAGLERKRQAFRTELESALHSHQEAIHLFLHTTLTHLQADYLKAAHTLIDRFVEMRALESLSRYTTGKALRAFVSNHAEIEELPKLANASGNHPDLSVPWKAIETALHRIKTEYGAAGIKLTNP